MPHRSPIIFWLLLAATLSIDLVAMLVFCSNSSNRQAITLYISLTYAQLSLLCVWGVADFRKTKVRSLVPIGGAIVVSLQVAWANVRTSGQLDWEGSAAVCFLLLLHVGLLFVLFWLAVPNAWISTREQPNRRRKQFSTLQLLVVMTGVAILLSLLRATRPLANESINIATFGLANVILLIGTLALLQNRWPLPLRLAACMFVAITISAISYWTGIAFSDELNPWAFFVVQCIVVASWLAVCLPSSTPSDSNSESLPPAGIA